MSRLPTAKLKIDFNGKCAAQHFGLWLIEAQWFASAVAAVRDGTWQPVAIVPVRDDETGELLFSIDENGIAVVPIQGQIVKGESSLGGTSSVLTRQALRKAVADDSVKGIMLAVDSPGGTVAGVDDLARTVVVANESKPVFVHIDGQGASAAYWIAAQGKRVSASVTSQIGSIGVMSVLEDSSEAAGTAGIKVHVVSTGGIKGGGVPGTEITDEMLDEVQDMVDGIGEVFFKAVAQGRGMTLAAVKKLADGRMYIAAQAKELGLIDAVEPFEVAMERLTKAVQPKRRISTVQRAQVTGV